MAACSIHKCVVSLLCIGTEVSAASVFGHAGFAVAFFDLLAVSATREQQNTFCSSMLDAWGSAQSYSAPSGWQAFIPFRNKGQAPLVPADCTSTLCLCLMAFGPGRIKQVWFQSLVLLPSQQNGLFI